MPQNSKENPNIRFNLFIESVYQEKGVRPLFSLVTRMSLLKVGLQDLTPGRPLHARATK